MFSHSKFGCFINCNDSISVQRKKSDYVPDLSHLENNSGRPFNLLQEYMEKKKNTHTHHRTTVNLRSSLFETFQYLKIL